MLQINTRNVLAAAMIALSAPTFATSSNHDTNINTVVGHASAESSAAAIAGSSSSVKSTNTNVSAAQGGNAVSVGIGGKSSSYSGGNTQTMGNSQTVGNTSQSVSTGDANQSVTVTDSGKVHHSGEYTVKNTPDVAVNPGFNTAPCRVAVGAGVSGPGFSVGGAGSVVDVGCDVWRDHDNLKRAGFNGAANIRLCFKPELADLLPFCNKPPAIEQKKEAGAPLY